MSPYRLSHLSDALLLRALSALVAQDRATTARLLAHLAEVDARKLYLPAAYPSMFAYSVGELGLSEDAAYRRIQVARTARQFPAIFAALAEGRLHLTGVLLLAPHLTTVNADELLCAATGKRKAEIEEWLARRFPRSELLPLVQGLPAALHADEQLAPERVGRHPGLSAPARIEAPAPRPLTPVAPERYALQLTIGQGTHDKLRHAQALLSHQVPSGEVAEVLDRALDALIARLERRKFAATTRPSRRPRRASANPRHIPAEVKRAVWQRDGGQCTFVSDSGHRCPARNLLEFDHRDEVARGGRATVERIRLRCRAHNQYTAEGTFGRGFMDRKREEAAAERARKAAEAERAQAAVAEKAKERDVVPWLRQLGFRADEARRAAAACESIPDAPLQERVRVALASLSRGRTRICAVG